MSTPTNELDALLMDSLQQLSAEFKQREARLTAQYKSCMEPFTKLERAQGGTNRAIEAFGRADAALSGHTGRHAVAVEAVGGFEQKVRSAIKQIDKSLGRGRGW